MNDLEIFEKFGRRLVLIGRKIYNLSDDLQRSGTSIYTNT